MGSSPETNDVAPTHARLLKALTERLVEAERRTETVRRALLAGDADSIESERARLETLAVEFKVVAGELARLEAGVPASPEDPGVASARAELEEAAARVARSSAIGSGLLGRLAALRRGLVAAAAAASGSDYLPTGRAAEFAPRGLRLRQRA